MSEIISFLYFIRVYDLQFVDEIMKIEAHEAEILCVEFSDPESGKLLFAIIQINVFRVQGNVYSVQGDLNWHISYFTETP